MPRQIDPVLSDMVDTIDELERALSGKGFKDFQRDWIMRLATQRALEIISEASRHLPDELLTNAPHIPWKNIRGVGNILRHEYHRIADDIVWAVVVNDLPPLKDALLRIRRVVKSGEGGGS